MVISNPARGEDIGKVSEYHFGVSFIMQFVMLIEIDYVYTWKISIHYNKLLIKNSYLEALSI